MLASSVEFYSLMLGPIVVTVPYGVKLYFYRLTASPLIVFDSNGTAPYQTVKQQKK